MTNGHPNTSSHAQSLHSLRSCPYHSGASPRQNWTQVFESLHKPTIVQNIGLPPWVTKLKAHNAWHMTAAVVVVNVRLVTLTTSSWGHLATPFPHNAPNDFRMVQSRVMSFRVQHIETLLISWRNSNPNQQQWSNPLDLTCQSTLEQRQLLSGGARTCWVKMGLDEVDRL